MATLIFVLSLIFGVGVFFYFKQSEKEQWKISGKKELKVKQYENYYLIRIKEPVNQETINLVTSLQEYNTHQKWLKEIINILEEEYKKNNLDIFSENSLNLSEKHKEIDEVINKEGNYKEICKYLQRRPIKELQEDLNKIIFNNKSDMTENETSKEQNEELYNLKNRVLNLIKEEIDRSEIIKIMKRENLDKEDFKIWCENRTWNINYFYEGNLQDIKFQKL